jgi:hypothetical protein
MEGVQRPSEVLDFTNLRGRLRDYCSKECIDSKTLNNQRLFESFRKECVQGPFWEVLSLQVETQMG